MLPQTIQSIVNIFSLCTFKIFRNHSSDIISPSLSLADNLIATQNNPLILKNLEDTSFTKHSYFVINTTLNQSRKWFRLKIHSVRLPCYVLLNDYNGVTNDVWMDGEGRLGTNWKYWIMRSLLKGLAGFRESPSFIIFEASVECFVFFKDHSQEYSVSSPYIWVTNNETYFFCKTCPSQLVLLSDKQLEQTR